MNRLTERDEFGNADIVGVESISLTENLDFKELNLVTNALNKLAEYEDLGPTPQQLKEIDIEFSRVSKELAEEKKKNQWIPVNERLPENEKEVEVSIERHYENKIHTFTCRAIHEDGTLTTDDSGYSWEDNDFLEYVEEKDSYLIPEGWWEQNRYCEEFGIIVDFVIAWKPLPELYKEETNETNTI